jgi:hypothetical protein
VSVRERLVLALVLAFLIDTSRPVHPLAHSHPNGGRPHVHLGDASRSTTGKRFVAGGAPRAPDGKPGYARACTSDLHVHLVSHRHVSHVLPPHPALVRGPYLLARVLDARSVRSATLRRGSARAPPPLFA